SVYHGPNQKLIVVLQSYGDEHEHDTTTAGPHPRQILRRPSPTPPSANRRPSVSVYRSGAEIESGHLGAV
ncbi:unnamed protein product, partial [Urochloa humidicola]